GQPGACARDDALPERLGRLSLLEQMLRLEPRRQLVGGEDAHEPAFTLEYEVVGAEGPDGVSGRRTLCAGSALRGIALARSDLLVARLLGGASWLQRLGEEDAQQRQDADNSTHARLGQRQPRRQGERVLAGW